MATKMMKYFVDVDECAIALEPGVPCFNGGTCTNTLGSYRCLCKQGWTGQNCEVGEIYSVYFIKSFLSP